MKCVPAPVPGRASAGSGAGPLLHHNCNNSDKLTSDSFQFLTPYHKKAAFVLSENCQKFIKQVGLNSVGFLTLTFPDNVKSNKEASRRFNNMNRRFLSRFFGMWMLVKERQVRGAWHYHILVDCKVDIRTGLDFEEIAAGNYSSASLRLRQLWRRLRKSLPAYGFGRSELLPIRKESEAISSYIGKYISKHIQGRSEEDKGVRLVSYSSNFSRSSSKFAWNSDGSKRWRTNLEKFSRLTKCYSLEALQKTFGRHWAHNLGAYIDAVDTLTPPEIERIKAVYSRHMREFRDEQGNIYPWIQQADVVDGKLVYAQTGREIY